MALVVALVGTRFSLDILVVSALTLGYGAIGWLDDWQVLHRRSNQGIFSPDQAGATDWSGPLYFLPLGHNAPADRCHRDSVTPGTYLAVGLFVLAPGRDLSLVAREQRDQSDGRTGRVNGWNRSHCLFRPGCRYRWGVTQT